MYYSLRPLSIFSFFFFNDTATTEIYTLSLHDALPIWGLLRACSGGQLGTCRRRPKQKSQRQDRKSTRLNSSHLVISYAVFCLKKKKKTIKRAYHVEEILDNIHDDERTIANCTQAQHSS